MTHADDDAERRDEEKWRQMSQPFDADLSIDAPETDLPVDVPDLDRGFGVPGENLGIDVATAPELEDAELGAVLEALLLVVDTPVTVEALAAATEQPAYRVAAKLRLMADELTERDSGIDLREAGGDGGCTPAPSSRHMLSDCCWTGLARSSPGRLWRRWRWWPTGSL